MQTMSTVLLDEWGPCMYIYNKNSDSLVLYIAGGILFYNKAYYAKMLSLTKKSKYTSTLCTCAYLLETLKLIVLLVIIVTYATMLLSLKRVNWMKT